MMPFPKRFSTVLSRIPLPVVQRITSMMLKQLLGQHPGLFSRLGSHLGKRYAFRPDDLPFAFLVEPAAPAIRVFRRQETFQADAGVEGPLFMLLALMEGRQDADALFFSRELTVTGDMEAMLALRNALDDSGIDLPRDLARLAGPLSFLAERAGNRLRERVLSEGPAAWN